MQRAERARPLCINELRRGALGTHRALAAAIPRSRGQRGQMNIAARLILGLSFGASAAACNHNESDAKSPAAKADADVVPGPRKATASARESIAESRCEREQRCNNVGEAKKFSSTDDCLARIRADWKDDLNARECPGGVNQAELSECLNEIRNENCESPLDTLERVAACTSNQICQS